jgi:small conductance mechanosensitive channel
MDTSAPETLLGLSIGFLPEPMRAQLAGYVSGFWAALPQILAAVVFLILVWIVVKVMHAIVPRILRRARLRTALIDVLVMLTSVSFWLLGGLIALTIAFPTITPGRAMTALGIGSVAVGFAFKDVFENFLAGLLLLIREPFSKGDYIKCEEIEGQIEEITIRDTHVRQTDGQLVVAPNGYLFRNPVTIRTARDVRRTTIICGVAYGEDVDHARAVIERAVRAVDQVRDDVQDVQIFAQAFGSSSIDFEVTWWTGSRPVDIRSSRDKVVAAIKCALDDEGIEIPFPYRTMTFKGPLPVQPIGATVEDGTKGSEST